MAVGSRRRVAASRAASPRGWVTLLVLLLATAIFALGPGTLRDALTGLTFTRPTAGVTTATPHVDGALQADLRTIGDSLTLGRLAASAIDLQSGASASLDAERAYPAASLFKLPILIEVLA